MAQNKFNVRVIPLWLANLYCRLYKISKGTSYKQSTDCKNGCTLIFIENSLFQDPSTKLNVKNNVGVNMYTYIHNKHAGTIIK